MEGDTFVQFEWTLNLLLSGEKGHQATLGSHCPPPLHAPVNRPVPSGDELTSHCLDASLTFQLRLRDLRLQQSVCLYTRNRPEDPKQTPRVCSVTRCCGNGRVRQAGFLSKQTVRSERLHSPTSGSLSAWPRPRVKGEMPPCHFQVVHW